MATNLPQLDSLIDEKIDYLIKNYFDKTNKIPKPTTPTSRSPSVSTSTSNLSTLPLNTNDNQNKSSSNNPRLESIRGNSYDDDDVKWGHIVVKFFDKEITKAKKKTSWFGQGKTDDTEDLKLWESWVINCKCLPLDRCSNISCLPSSTSSSISDLVKNRNQNHSDPIELSTDSFQDNLMKIVDIVDGHKEHIPPITSLESSPFPYKISVSSDTSYSFTSNYNNEDDASWGKYIKNMLD